MILNDKQILELAHQGMITPFEPTLVRQSEGKSAISYGLSSYGYDIRLSPKKFVRFNPHKGVIDPKNFDPKFLEEEVLNQDEQGSYFVIPPFTYALGVAVEKLKMPPDVTGTCIGKSTYARAGLIANLTPVEAGWVGHLTLEFFNAAPAPIRVYAGEGIAQIQFHRGEPCSTSYGDRACGGKYQGQDETITTAKA